ncbi:MAG: hypothetical protein OEN20_09075, partial [Gammaproteobacteria bacterium]|nr:hypothetical protein [Gammaproteobacteria bacterium]
ALKPFAVLSTLLLFGCAIQPPVAGFSSPAGDWNTRWQSMDGRWHTGRLRIADEARATFTGQNARLYFYAIGANRRWQGYWIEDRPQACEQARDGSKFWGVAVFQFNQAYDRFEGSWDMCGESREVPWNGTR